jgi:hypothetical protein
VLEREPIRVERHRDDVPDHHRREVDNARNPQGPSNRRPRQHEPAMPSPRIPDDPGHHRQNHDLRAEQHRVRQQPRLPVTPLRQPRDSGIRHQHLPDHPGQEKPAQHRHHRGNKPGPRPQPWKGFVVLSPGFQSGVIRPGSPSANRPEPLNRGVHTYSAPGRPRG